MKTLFLTLIAAAALCLPAQGKQRIVTERDSLGNTKRIIELLDTVRDGKAETDTLSITTYETAQDHTYTTSRSIDYTWDITDWEWLGSKAQMFVTMFFVGSFVFFITPLAIILLIFYFRNKNRKRRFLLMQQALASGQPLPKDVFKEVTLPDNRVKGIKNIALGLGLVIFLWLLTGEASISCIGLLIMCIGAGQLVIYYTTPKKEERPTTHTETRPRQESTRDETRNEESSDANAPTAE